ncbi:MAG: hypothetical protein SNI51_03705 [Rikenellaceae bacterium]
MKNIWKLTAAFVLAILMSACEKYGDDLETPYVRISVSSENPKVGEVVTVTIETDAQYLSIFTGDDGHVFERSRIYAIMNNDWESFQDTCYRVSLCQPGQTSTWHKYFKDYETMSEVYEDFDFFGAIEDVELVVYNEGDFPEALLDMSFPGTNQLKFTITDRRIPSGISFKPNINMMATNSSDRGGYTLIESRLVACDEDKVVREGGNSYSPPAWWTFYTEQLVDYGDWSTGYKYEITNSKGVWLASLTNDPLSGRPTNGFYALNEIFLNDSEYLSYFVDQEEKVMITDMDLYFTRNCVDYGSDTSEWKYDLDQDGVDEYYSCELNPNTGLPVNSSDYNKYKGFQGDVYLSFLEIGTDEYEPWNTGVSLGSCYYPTGISKTYEYTYTHEGQFEIYAVATNVGNKQHSDIDYDEGRGNSLDNYPTKRSTYAVKVNVTQ